MELILAISVGVIVTLAATTILLLGLRTFHRSNRAAQHRNQVISGITIMENILGAHSGITVIENSGSYTVGSDHDMNTETSLQTILTYDQTKKAILNGGSTGATILENVEQFTVIKKTGSSLLCVDMTVEGEVYSFYFLTGEAVTASGSDAQTLGAEEFIKTLRSQLEMDGQPNTGFILQGGSSTGERYANWYKSSWGYDTAWCSCFVSWALEQCRGYIAGTTPKYASVNSFRLALIRTGAWKDSSYTPNTGDLIFFDWDRDGKLDHVGAVEKVKDGRVYTIEGNSGETTAEDGTVRQKDYSLNNPHIAGYGLINWIG